MPLFGQLEISYADGRRRHVDLSGESAAIGSAPDNDLALDDASLAPHHFQLLHRKGVVFLVNLDLARGTMVAGALARDPQPRRIIHGAQIRAGSIRITYRAGSDLPTAPMKAVAESRLPLQPGFTVSLDRSAVDVFPAASASVEIAIHNQRAQEERYEIAVRGLPVAWISLSQTFALIAGRETLPITLHISPERRAGIAPADYAAVILVAPMSEPERQTGLDLRVRLRGFGGLCLALDKARVRPGEDFQLLLRNQGNQVLPLRLSARICARGRDSGAG